MLPKKVGLQTDNQSKEVQHVFWQMLILYLQSTTTKPRNKSSTRTTVDGFKIPKVGLRLKQPSFGTPQIHQMSQHPLTAAQDDFSQTPVHNLQGNRCMDVNQIDTISHASCEAPCLLCMHELL